MSTSTLDSNNICARVRARWGNLIPESLRVRADFNIALSIFSGMERLGRVIKDSSDRPLLVVDISATPTDGRIDLTGADFAYTFIDTLKLPGAIDTAAESALTFSPAPSLDALKATTPTDTSKVWFYLRGQELIFKNPADGALDTYATALKLAMSYIPVLGNADRPLPGALDGQLIDRVAEVVKELGGLQFLKMDPDEAGEAVKRLQ